MFQELGPKERKKRSLEAAVLSTGIVTVVYVVVAVLGYLYCGDSIKGNVFMSMPNDSVLVIIARIAIAINVMIGFPFIVCPGREGCNTFISEICKKYGDLSPNLKHVIGTTILLVLGVVGWFVTSISIVFSFCGAIGSSAISFIFPGIYYFYTFRNEPTRKISRVLSVVCIVLGFVLMILGVVLQIVDLAS